MNQNESQEKKIIRKRILAFLMAVLLMGGMVLGWAVQIKFAQLEYLGTVLQQAAMVTGSSTPYLSDSALERAWKILRHAIKKPESYEDFETYASLAIARKQYSEAAVYMQGCIDRCPPENRDTLSVLQLRLGSLYALSDEPEKAIACFDEALLLRPDLADAYLLRAQMYSLLENSELAVENLDRYEQYAAADPIARTAIGSIYEGAGEYRKAAECYSVGLAYPQSYSPELLMSRARCYLMLGETKKARSDLESFSKENGEAANGEAEVMLGICQMGDGEYGEAVDSFHAALEKGYPQQAAVYGQCVLCAYVGGDYDRVIEDAQAALRLDGQDGEVQNGQILMEQGLMSKAELYQWMGLAWLAKENFGEARTAFTRSAKEQALPGNDYYIGLCYASEGKNQEAIKQFDKSIEKQEMESLCHYNRAVCLLQTGKVEEGLTDLLVVLQRNDDPDATAAASALLKELGVDVVVETATPEVETP